MIVYGIKNCNTVKSALEWLNQHKVEYQFHDYKAKGITVEKLKQWSEQVGWEALINKRGTTWRKLPPEVQEHITNETQAIALMMEKNSVIKRPLIEENNVIVALGFDENKYSELFQ